MTDLQKLEATVKENVSEEDTDLTACRQEAEREERKGEGLGTRWSHLSHAQVTYFLQRGPTTYQWYKQIMYPSFS